MTLSKKVGDPFAAETFQGPQISEGQFNRVMNYIDIGKKEGATCYLGGNRVGNEGYFIEPTIFTGKQRKERFGIYFFASLAFTGDLFIVF